MGDATITAPPEDLDYELWTGPAPLLPYMGARPSLVAWASGLWRWHAARLDRPSQRHRRVGACTRGDQARAFEAVDWTFPETDIYNTPIHFDIRCQYSGGVETSISDSHKQGTKWIGDGGWLFVNRSIIESSDPRWAARIFSPAISMWSHRRATIATSSTG